MKHAIITALALTALTSAALTAVPAGCSTRKPTDLYPVRHASDDPVILTWEDAGKRCFHGLNIGDSKEDAAAILAPEFEQTYVSERAGGIGIYVEKPDAGYYVCASFDENNRILLISYQKNQIYYPNITR